MRFAAARVEEGYGTTPPAALALPACVPCAPLSRLEAKENGPAEPMRGIHLSQVKKRAGHVTATRRKVSFAYT